MPRVQRSEIATKERPSEIKTSPRKTQPKSATVVPYDPVNEIVLIAVVLVDTSVADRLLPTIPGRMFYGEGHAEIWKVLQEMHAHEPRRT